MTDDVKRDGNDVLAHWTYSRDEWKGFMRWKKRKISLLHYLLHWLSPRSSKAPVIVITQNKVHTDDHREWFHDEKHQLKAVNIQDAGSMNVMELRLETSSRGTILSKELYIPVPKGRLREAIEVQQRLNNTISRS